MTATPKSESLHTSAIQRWQAGDAQGARDLVKAAIDLAPDVAAYHLNLGVFLKDLGLVDERIACYRCAVELDPKDPMSHANLSGALNAAGEHIQAEAEARIALQIAPDRSESWMNLGNSLTGQKRWKDAATAYDKAIQHKPGWITALHAAAQLHHRAGQLQVAAQRYHQMLAAANGQTASTIADIPIHALWRTLGSILAQLKQFSNAEACFREALRHLPGDPTLLTDLGNALKDQGKIDAAAACYRTVADMAPELAAPHCNLGTIAQALGRHDEAIACYRAALDIDPSLVPIWGNIGNCLTYSPNHGPGDVLDTFSDFNRQLAMPLRDLRPHANTRDPDRKLRVGYLSPDFRRHAVAYFALPLLEGHHRDQVEVVCYYNHRQHDEWTARFKQAANEWVDCIELDDDALAERIRGDRIDILVDLAGHTEGNRLLVFARKPAPLQATWLGYVTTTGLTAIDYRLTHVDADPPGSENDYSERLWHLPGTMWCYRPLPDMPDVAPPPFLHKGYVTFGYFNRFSKVSARVLESWVRILSAVPDSRLVICIPEGSVRQQVAAFFSERGIAAERLFAYDKLPHDKFWALHADVDIALDPYPFNGGTTSCETLWLGVPIISCTGTDSRRQAADMKSNDGKFPARFSSRMGYAFLNSLGLPELAVTDDESYVKLAVALAQDPARLEQLRKSLRPRMANAPLTDEARFVKEMEDAYRGMWKQWCRPH